MKESGYFPAGAEFDPSAPYNQSEIPEKDFNVTISQTLSKSVTLTTDDYIPGASGVDYEDDGEGGSCAYSWHDPDDTSNTNWIKVYFENKHYTPNELIRIFKEMLEQQLESLEGCGISSKERAKVVKAMRKQYKHLIEECDSWIVDETEIVED